MDPKLVDPDSVFGCWGDNDDDYYGGGYYADMLKMVYPAVKSADPQAQVLIGDCCWIVTLLIQIVPILSHLAFSRASCEMVVVITLTL